MHPYMYIYMYTYMYIQWKIYTEMYNIAHAQSASSTAMHAELCPTYSAETSDVCIHTVEIGPCELRRSYKHTKMPKSHVVIVHISYQDTSVPF